MLTDMLLQDNSMRFVLSVLVKAQVNRNKLDECVICKQPKNYKPGETPGQVSVVQEMSFTGKEWMEEKLEIQKYM